MQILLLSGPLAVGKSSLAEALVERFSFERIRSSGHLRTIAEERGAATDRTGLQALGDTLDEETQYLWLLSDVALPLIENRKDVSRWLVDCVRKPEQVAHFRNSFGRDVVHVHLTASEPVLRLRYERRAMTEGSSSAIPPYEIATSHPNEIAARGLGAIADHLVNLESQSASEAATRIMNLKGI